MIQLVSSEVRTSYQIASLVRWCWCGMSWIDSLKCIAWKGRALVVGFAAGNIEKVDNPSNRNPVLTRFGRCPWTWYYWRIYLLSACIGVLILVSNSFPPSGLTCQCETFLQPRNLDTFPPYGRPCWSKPYSMSGSVFGLIRSLDYSPPDARNRWFMHRSILWKTLQQGLPL